MFSKALGVYFEIWVLWAHKTENIAFKIDDFSFWAMRLSSFVSPGDPNLKIDPYAPKNIKRNGFCQTLGSLSLKTKNGPKYAFLKIWKMAILPTNHITFK